MGGCDERILALCDVGTGVDNRMWTDLRSGLRIAERIVYSELMARTVREASRIVRGHAGPPLAGGSCASAVTGDRG